MNLTILVYDHTKCRESGPSHGHINTATTFVNLCRGKNFIPIFTTNILERSKRRI